eukprot:m.495015 g.495015  ORF g.495015 m.495015 type:complete len:239 (-) comp42798_c0_seq1:122-838(-)
MLATDKARLAAFEDEMAKMNAEFTQWKTSAVQRHKAQTDKHKQALVSSQECLHSLQQKLTGLQDTHQRKATRLARQEADIAAREEALAKLRKSESKMLERKTVSEQARDEQQAEFEKASAELETERVRVTTKEGEMTKGQQWYEQRLGLTFERRDHGGQEALDFAFTNLLDKEPERKFKFTLFSDAKTNIYQVLATNPVVPEEDLSVLVGILNQTNDVSVFVKSMRNKFVEQAKAAPQ